MELKINDEYLFAYLKQLGYEKRNSGRWMEELQDDGQGFPRTIYTCPFCSYVSYERANYCSKCGARLNDDSKIDN